MTTNTQITALYSRLSREDGEDGVSNSIVNQKAMLEDYAARNGFVNCVHFSDDGFSGGNFERPAWKRMIEEVDAGNVLAILTKDMSRIGREYLQTGYYTEVYFREKRVRFIAISNNIDSDNNASAEFAPFLNIMSEWYLRDISRKIKASFDMKARSGKRMTSRPIFGYKLDTEDKSKWVIDDEAAAIVRRIFALTIDGIGPYAIATILAEEKIERPLYYMAVRGYVNMAPDERLKYSWEGASIRGMLARKEYIGHTVNHRTEKPSYKSKKASHLPESEHLIFENTHPAIIDDGTFELAQKCRSVRRRADAFGDTNPLTGLVYCADCGKRMYNSRARAFDFTDKYGFERHSSGYDYYRCQTAVNASRKYISECSKHHISTAALREIALLSIRAAVDFANSDSRKFAELVRERFAVAQEQTAKSSKRQIAKNEKRLAELERIDRSLYEDKALGKIDEAKYNSLSVGYEQKRAELTAALSNLKSEIEAYASDSVRAESFLKIAKQYSEITELTPAMLNELIDKIVVYECVYVGGKRTQRVEVSLAFIGEFLPPSEPPAPPTAEEIEAERKREAQLARSRVNSARYRERLKAGLVTPSPRRGMRLRQTEIEAEYAESTEL